jgi:hypothetical protein
MPSFKKYRPIGMMPSLERIRLTVVQQKESSETGFFQHKCLSADQ